MQEISLTLFYLFLFNFLIYKFRIFQFRNFKPLVTHFIFNLKFLAGIFIWLVYTFYYKDVQNNDVHKFYNDALVIHQAAIENPKAFLQLITGSEDENTITYTSQMNNWERNFDEAPFNENKTIIRLNALLLFISFKTYLVHTLFFCFISLVGWILLANSVLQFADTKNSILALPVLLMPSVLFWTSGVMKEPLLVFGLGLLIYGIADYELRITKLTAIAFGALIILFTKFFVLACLAPALVAFLLFRKNENKTFVLLKYAVVSVLFLSAAFNIRNVVPKINLQQMLINKQTNSIKEAEYFNAGSQFEIPQIEDNALSILKAGVVGIWNTYFRPHIGDSKNMMMMLCTAENIIVHTFVFFFLIYFDWRSEKNLNLCLFLLTFSLAYFAITAMCTPVIGNLVRYKTPLVPVFMLAFIIKVKPKALAGTLSFVFRS